MWPRFYSILFLLTLVSISTYLMCSKFINSSWESQLADISFTINSMDGADQKKLDCIGLISRNKSIEMHEKWTFDPLPLEDAILKSEDSCAVINEQFEFRDKPLSKEEEEYPLAYGLIVYKEAIQERPPISWGSFEIINSTYACLEYLSSLKTKWKYYQYLSGTDVPLRTNLEMVKIFKVFNGTSNVNYGIYQRYRLFNKNESDSPLPLFKSSLSTLIPRETADFIVKSNVTQELLKFLCGTDIPDESFWGTLTGNAKIFPIPGGFDAQEILDFTGKFENKTKYYEMKSITGENTNTDSMHYYLSRYQLWEKDDCKGKLSRNSCVFGVRDLSDVLKKPHFVAHKFYLHFQPAAFFCAIKEINRRSLYPVPFDTQLYSEIPQVEMKRGVALEKLKHPEWLFWVEKKSKSFIHGS